MLPKYRHLIDGYYIFCMRLLCSAQCTLATIFYDIDSPCSDVTTLRVCIIVLVNVSRLSNACLCAHSMDGTPLPFCFAFSLPFFSRVNSNLITYIWSSISLRNLVAIRMLLKLHCVWRSVCSTMACNSFV